LKPEWWGAPMVQEKYQEEKACDKRTTTTLLLLLLLLKCTYHISENKLLVDKYYHNKVQTQVYITPCRELNIILLSSPDL